MERGYAGMRVVRYNSIIVINCSSERKKIVTVFVFFHSPWGVRTTTWRT